MQTRLRIAEKSDAARLNQALQMLSADLGDPHRATPADLEAAGWGATPAFRAVLAEVADPVGVALYSPLYSTTRGGAGLYVSDLWIAQSMRGQGLGAHLLAAALADAELLWNATFLKLHVYDTSPDAARFYTRLGFAPTQGQNELILDKVGCNALRGPQ